MNHPPHNPNGEAMTPIDPVQELGRRIATIEDNYAEQGVSLAIARRENGRLARIIGEQNDTVRAALALDAYAREQLAMMQEEVEQAEARVAAAEAQAEEDGRNRQLLDAEGREARLALSLHHGDAKLKPGELCPVCDAVVEK